MVIQGIVYTGGGSFSSVARSCSSASSIRVRYSSRLSLATVLIVRPDRYRPGWPGILLHRPFQMQAAVMPKIEPECHVSLKNTLQSEAAWPE